MDRKIYSRTSETTEVLVARHGSGWKRILFLALVLGLAALLAFSTAIQTIAASQPWLVEGDQGANNLGQVVASAGDVNGDGYDDLLVGGRHDFGNGLTGVAYAYYGSSQGLSTTPDWTAPDQEPNQYSLIALAGAGDVNGDGYADVIVGDSDYSGNLTEAGRAYLYYGSSSGLSSTPGWVADGEQTNLYFGTAVAGVGDVNGDGYDDVLVGAPNKFDPVVDYWVGEALLYLGSSSGLSPTPAWTVLGPAGSSYFGGRLNGAGDVNGDGYADFLLSDFLFSGSLSGEGRVYLYLGSASGPAGTPPMTIDGDQAHDYFGMALGPAGDVNGDGFPDVIIGAPSYSDPEGIEGRASLYYGSPGGLNPSASWSAEGNQYGAYFGNAVSSAGDVNGDGYADVVIGAYGTTDTELAEGKAFLYLGSRAGLEASPAWTAEGDQEQAAFGSSVSSSGDVNGDGLDGWAVGAPKYDRGQTDEGIALAFEGLGTNPLPTPPPVTPSPTPTPTIYHIHISDLDGSSYSQGRTWTAIVQVEVRTSDGQTIDQTVVSGAWSTGGSSQCTTSVYGVCSVRLSGLPKKVGSITFTVTDVQRSQGIYEPSMNTDPDGDSNGTQIIVAR